MTNQMKRIVSYIAAAAAILMLNQVLLWPRETSHSALLVCAAAALGWLGALTLTESDTRLKRYALVFGFAFALAQVCGARLDAADSIADPFHGAWSLVLLLAAVVALTPSAGALFVGLVKWAQSMQTRGVRQGKLTEKSVFWLSFAIIFACWIPALLAYWPGVFSYDVYMQIRQNAVQNYSKHLPLAHTLLIGGFHALGVWLGSANTGVTLYCVFQMAATAFAMAFMLRYLWRAGCPKWFVWMGVAIFALAPFHQILAISTTKDILFADAVAVWAVLMVMGVREPEVTRRWKWKIGCVSSGVFAILMRTNALAALAAAIIAGWVLLRPNKELRRRILCLNLCVLVGYTGVHEGLSAALNAHDGPVYEYLSVPVQQLSRVHCLSPKESRQGMNRHLVFAAYYDPAISDPVKNHMLIDETDIPDFLNLWITVGLKYPVVYMDAFGYLTKGYWYLDDTSHATLKGDTLEAHEGYVGTIFTPGYGVEMDGQWPALYDWYERMYSANEYLQIPLLPFLTSPALWCWLILIALLAAMYLRKRGVLIAMWMNFAMYVLLFMGPCCIVRYAYPFMLIAPFAVGMLATSEPTTAV